MARGREALDAGVAGIRAKAQTKVVGIAADVANAADVKRAYDEAMRAFGKLDIVVNNAGTSNTTPFEQLTDEVMQQDLDLKLFGAIRLTRLAWPQMRERRWGRVINVLNIGAKAPRAGSAPTSISRAAGLRAHQGAGRGGRAAQHSGQRHAGRPDRERSARAARQAHRRRARRLHQEPAKNIPLGRMGKPEEFASLATLLVSDNCGFVSGTAINVDGASSPVW